MTSSPPAAALTAMWVHDNPVDPAVDPRGGGYAPAAPDRLAAFARAGGLREVHLEVPAGVTRGPVADWLRAAVDALHDAGVVVSAVADLRDATGAWALATAALVPVDRFQVLVPPSTEPTDGRRHATAGVAGHPGAHAGVGALGPLLVGALGAITGAGTGLPVDAAVPWWCVPGTPDGTGAWLDRGPDAVLGAADRVVLVAPGARAAGPDGVLERAAAGVAALSAAGRPFLLGVETGTSATVGGADRTFWEEGPVALVRECRAVAAALADVSGFGGVAVRSHRTWRRLLGV